MATIAVAAIPARANAQDRLWTALGDQSYSEFGGAGVSVVGDVNGDGVLDATAISQIYGFVRLLDGVSGAKIVDVGGSAALARYADVNGDGVEDLFHLDGNYIGNSHVVSGKTLTNLYSFTGWSGRDVGDVDGDSIHDFVAYRHPGGLQPSDLRMYSGANGALLWTSSPAGRSYDYGYSAQPAHDWNGDGIADVVVVDFAPPNGIGPLVVVSSKDGSVLATGGPASGAAQFEPCWLLPFDDFDGDGVDDLLLSNQYENVGGKLSAGKIWVVSGATLAELAHLAGSDTGEQLSLVGVYGDVDGDGRTDFAIGKDRYLSAPIDVYSGASLRRLYRIQPDPSYDFLQTATGPVDFDRDGLCDMVVGRPYAAGVPGTSSAGAATVERGRTAFLSADPFSKPYPRFLGGGWSASERTFYFHLADFLPGTSVSLQLVETDGVAITPILVGTHRVDGNGEAEYGVAFDPAHRSFGVQAVGTDHLGHSVTTAIERFGYR